MREIPLSGKNGEGLVTLVDDDDYERFYDLKLYLASNGYAFTGGRRDDPLLNNKKFHRVILNLDDDLERNNPVDHINGNRLDNRKINLRLVDHSSNSHNSGPRVSNTSGAKGVNLEDGKWRVRMHLGEYYIRPSDRARTKRKVSLGRYDDIEDAITAYDLAVIEHLDEHAFTNRPREYYT